MDFGKSGGGGLEENRLKRCLQGVKVTEGWIHTLRGGVDLSEFDRVH